VSDAVLELSGVSKDYRGLRPLRIERLAVGAGEAIAILGLDHVTAEVFVNLATGATLPDRGAVKVFGCSTASIADSAEWLTIVDRFGIVSERAVLLDALSVIQNLVMPFTLDIEPPADDIRARAEALAREVELPESTWARPLAELDRPARVRVRLARALALGPAIVLLEHIAADLARPDAILVGRLVREVARGRRAAVVAATADEAFARAAADRVLMLEPATGRLAERRRWFRRA